MENKVDLPFEVGQEGEARSFQKGYRGAWFRCKIKDITKINGEIGYVLDFYDFPEDKPEWTQLYQVPPHKMGRSKEKRRELMLRPCYPPKYNAKEMPQASVISEVSVIVDDSWKVGDLVDWFTEGCYWCGKIIRLLDDGEAQIELLKPPHGEGSVYDVKLKDVRPFLDWSLAYGWKVPTQEGHSGRPRAWLLKPINQDAGKTQITNTYNLGQETEAASSLKLSFCSSGPTDSDEIKSTGTTEVDKQSLRSTVAKKLKNKQTKSTTSHKSRDSNNKTNSGQTPDEPTKADVADGAHLDSGCKYIANGGLTLNSSRFDTLEAAVLDLEEYVNKVKLLKMILRYGISSSSDGTRSQWEFVEPFAASGTRK